jgi:Mrp family chromosome partitioning ATPase
VAQLKVAVVSREPHARLEAARIFDAAPAEWSVTMHESAPPGADVVVYGTDVGGGGIVADPQDPATVLAAVGAAARPSSVVAVTSASGGAGATTVALHLAAATGSGACYVDLVGSAAHRLGLVDSVTWAGADSEAALRRAALPVAGGFRALIPPDPLPEGAGVLDGAQRIFERLVVDVPPGRGLAAVARRASVVVLVVAPTVPAARRARDLLDGLDHERVAVVTNRVGPGGEKSKIELERVLGHKIGLQLPCCPRLRDVEDHDALLTTKWSRWSMGIDRLIKAVDPA